MSKNDDWPDIDFLKEMQVLRLKPDDLIVFKVEAKFIDKVINFITSSKVN